MSKKTEPTITVRIDSTREPQVIPHRNGYYGTAVIEGAAEFPLTVNWRIDQYHNLKQQTKIAQALDADQVSYDSGGQFGPWDIAGGLMTLERVVTKPSRKHLGKLF